MPIAPSPAVKRACELLDVLRRHPAEAFSVSELGRRVGAPRATCDSILQALAGQGLVTRRDSDLRYELGPACLALGDAARSARPGLDAACTETELLARSTGAVAAVTVRDGTEVRVLQVFDFGPPIGLRTRPGQAVPLVPPFGAVFVAWAEADAADWIARGRAALRDDELRRYVRALAAVRRRGYSITVATRSGTPDLAVALEAMHSGRDADGARRARDEAVRRLMHSEYLPADVEGSPAVRLSQLSAPVFDGDGRVVAAVMLLGPEHDVTDVEISSLGDMVRAAARRATERAAGRIPTRTAPT